MPQAPQLLIALASAGLTFLVSSLLVLVNLRLAWTAANHARTGAALRSGSSPRGWERLR